MVKNQSRALLFGLSAVLLWSTVATAFKLTLAEMAPSQMLFFACFTSVIALTAIALRRTDLGQIATQWRQNWRRYLLTGLLNPFSYYLVLFNAYDRLPAQQAQSLNYSWAITLSLLAVPLLGQKLRRCDLVAAILAYFGVLVIATNGDLSGLNFEHPVGVALALLSTVLWALYWIVNTKDKGDPIISLLLSFIVALPLIMVVCVWQGVLTLPSWQGLFGAVYIGLFEMGITFVLWLQALRFAERTAPITNLIFLSPFLSLFLITTFLGESIQSTTLIGLVFIVIALALQQVAPKWFAQRRRSRAESPSSTQ